MPRNTIRISLHSPATSPCHRRAGHRLRLCKLKKAATATSYTEAAAHYQNAAQRLPWRSHLYGFAGHAYYHAKEYAQADAAYQKAFDRQAFSPEGWVAWGDVNYLMDNQERAAEIWEQALGAGLPRSIFTPGWRKFIQSRGETSKATADSPLTKLTCTARGRDQGLPESRRPCDGGEFALELQKAKSDWRPTTSNA